MMEKRSQQIVTPYVLKIKMTKLALLYIYTKPTKLNYHKTYYTICNDNALEKVQNIYYEHTKIISSTY